MTMNTLVSMLEWCHPFVDIYQQAYELTLIIPGDEDICANSQDVILHPRGGPLICVSECNPTYLALHFPLLCPTGQLSWHPHIPYMKNGNSTSQQEHFVSLCDFAKFCL